MKKHIINILVLLLSSTAVLSCASDLALKDDGGNSNVSKFFFALSISGTVTDMETGVPLEDIKIDIDAFSNGSAVYNKTVYTDNNGRFLIAFDGYREPSSIAATAEDIKGIYQSGRHDILIQWDSQYNIKDGVLYINDCDFYLKKNK